MDAEDAARFDQTNGKEIEDSRSVINPTAILICTHAASLIAIGRALTGKMPDSICEDDFKTYTCGISKFNRRVMYVAEGVAQVQLGKGIPEVLWKNGRGIAGGWTCEANGSCAHLDGGEERGWFVIWISLHIFVHI